METLDTGRPPARQDPLSDYFFIKVVGEKGDEGQLLGFLNAALKRTGDERLVAVEILENKTFSAEYIGGKASILDLRAQLEDGSRIGIEVQLSNLKNMDRRSLYYWSKEYAAGIKEGEDYISLVKAIAINIVDFDFLETDKVHTIFHVWEDGDPRLMLTDVLEIHFLNMVKWRKLEGKDIEGDPLHRWLAYFDRNSPPELIEEVKKMGTKNSAQRALTDHMLNVPAQKNFTVHGNSKSPLGDCARCGAILMADERMVYVTGNAEAIPP
ncbi:MAG: Rpn family recombination-promoting nuclease/putative transposase [Treponema sp.]|nr:Rpn family recombination-promoting nuclease/putative transposase [Treponema sp.]